MDLLDESIVEIVKSKYQWIHEKMRHPQKYQIATASGKELVNGEPLLYLGRQYRIEIIEGSNPSIMFAQKFCIPLMDNKDRSIMLKEWYVEQAQEKIVPKVLKYAKDLGVQVEKVKIVDNRFRGLGGGN